MHQLTDVDQRYLRDQSDITALIHRFVQGADNRDPEAMLSCVSEDGIVSFNGGELVLHGHEELRKWVYALFDTNGILKPGMRSTHMMANTVVKLDGDRATAATSGVTYHTTAANSNIIRGVHYSDEFARIDGEWRLVHRRHRCDWQMESPLSTSPLVLKPNSERNG